ncbi:hypothetical protein HK405_003392 [Cladochytrium tenue]|nr:hypothetical protein HK405_003392 [Cladochytrium tenue]
MPIPAPAEYARDYATYYEALDFLYYERARAAAAHQHYMAAAAAAAAAHYRPLYWPPPPQPLQALPAVYPAGGSLPPMTAPVIRPATTPHALARSLPLLPSPVYPAAAAPVAAQPPPGRPASPAQTAMAHAPPPPPPSPASAVVATPAQVPTYKTVFARPAAAVAAVTSAC